MITNETPIEYICDNGTQFECDRADLNGGVIVTSRYQVGTEKMMADFAEFGAWHKGCIHEHLLGGFQGYDCVRYIFIEPVKSLLQVGSGKNPIATIHRQGSAPMDVRFSEATEWGTTLPDGYKLYGEPIPEQCEPIAWESTTEGYIKYITQSKYQKFSDEAKEWYKPYKCSSCLQPQQSAIKDHQIAETINAIRDIAVEFHGTQQLRERIAGVLRPILSAQQVSADPKKAENEQLQRLLTQVERWGIEHTGNEPSISCFHRALNELVDFVKGCPPQAAIPDTPIYKIKLKAGDFAHGSMGKEKYLMCRDRFIADGCPDEDKGVFMTRDYFGWRQPKNGVGFVFSSFRDDYEGRFLTFEQIMEKEDTSLLSAAPSPVESLANKNIQMVEWIQIDSAEDVESGDSELILWDGCDFAIDYVDCEVDFGTSFFANGTEATHYLKGLKPPIEAENSCE